MSMIAKLTRNILDLVFPCACVICGKADAELCSSCQEKIVPNWQRVDAGASYLTTPVPQESIVPNNFRLNLGGRSFPESDFRAIFPVYTPYRYRGTVKELIVSWKHTNLRDLERQILRLWDADLRQLQQMLAAADMDLRSLFPQLDCTREMIVVNAPSGFRRRYDGQLIAWKLALALAAVFAAQPQDALRKSCISNGA
ncbi:hypothetical protein [Arcanobacterium hippocoleae]|uniref:hypothetical protein n=1 Tax=Arcanobacterium hippocoleae TaxID=149017 RepID=UPI00333E321F